MLLYSSYHKSSKSTRVSFINSRGSLLKLFYSAGIKTEKKKKLKKSMKRGIFYRLQPVLQPARAQLKGQMQQLWHTQHNKVRYMPTYTCDHVTEYNNDSTCYMQLNHYLVTDLCHWQTESMLKIYHIVLWVEIKLVFYDDTIYNSINRDVEIAKRFIKLEDRKIGCFLYHLALQNMLTEWSKNENPVWILSLSSLFKLSQEVL